MQLLPEFRMVLLKFRSEESLFVLGHSAHDISVDCALKQMSNHPNKAGIAQVGKTRIELKIGRVFPDNAEYGLAVSNEFSLFHG